MRRLLCTFALLCGTLASWPISSASAAPDPTNCTGYAEPRVYMEDQSWWSPQKGPATHPGTGQMGHIHIETCFPVFQHFGSTGTIPFDILIRLHDFPGELKDLRIASYGDGKLNAFSNINWRCPIADCARWFHVELPLSQMQYSGLHALQLEAYAKAEDGKIQYTLPRWPIYVDNGKPAPPAGSVAANIVDLIQRRGIIGDSWYTNTGAGGNYAQTSMAAADFPWDLSTGQPRLVSGIWTPTVYFEGEQAHAYLDPMLHAMPPVLPTVYSGLGVAWGPGGFNKLRIDTRPLPDGMHRLLIGTCMNIEGGMHCGNEVIRFVTENHPEDTKPLTDTTAPMVMHMRFQKKRFRAAASGPTAKTRNSGSLHSARKQAGALLSYVVDEDSTVNFVVQRAISGKRARGRCVKPKRAKRHAKRCTRWKTLRGSFSVKAHEGENQLKFRGRLRGRKQGPARYRLVAVATDAAGNHSMAVRARYRIVRH